MKLTFHNSKSWGEFYQVLRDNKMMLDVAGKEFHVLSITTEVAYSNKYVVGLELLHNPKRVAPEWTLGEEYLKNLRQKNSNLLKFTEQAIQMFVYSGDAERYLKKYNNDGTEK